METTDKVVIFYGKNPSAISFQLHIQIAESKASVEYIQLDKVGKNFLDFQLATYMGYLIATTKEQRYYIVSKDSGYESVIAFWKKKKSHLQIKRQQAIDEKLLNTTTPQTSTPSPAETIPTQAIAEVEKEKTLVEIATTKELATSQSQVTPKKPVSKELPESFKKKIRTKMKPENLKGGSYTKIYHLFLKASSKQNFNVGLVKAFQQEKGNQFYKILLPEFEAYLHTQAEKS